MYTLKIHFKSILFANIPRIQGHVRKRPSFVTFIDGCQSVVLLHNCSVKISFLSKDEPVTALSEQHCVSVTELSEHGVNRENVCRVWSYSRK